MFRPRLPLLIRYGFLLLAARGTDACQGTELAPLFTDHAVLQRDKAVSVWGKGKPGETVEVTFGPHKATATADADGRWMVRLPPMPASRQPEDLLVKGADGSVTKKDVLVGDVWLAAGQSNMERSVQRIETPAEEIARATVPLIRHFTVQKAVAERPTDQLGGEWVVCSPQTVGTFTAVGYFFAREMTEALDVPVGIIHSSWGGTRIDAWSNPDLVKSDPAFAGVVERWQKAAAEYPKKKDAYEAALAQWQREAQLAKERGIRFAVRAPRQPEGAPGHYQMPSGLYNGMIHPLIPYALRGFLWYQGESNALRPEEYARLFPALITDWRKQFGQGDLSFYFVQISSYKGLTPTEDWALFREVQSRALSLPETGMAVTIDIGDPQDIHPKNKKEVGRRLALIARNRLFHLPGEDTGPTLKELKKEGQTIRLVFSHAEGLHSSATPVGGFELAGADAVYHPAEAALEGNTVVVKAEAVKEPASVRYAWSNTPAVTLFNNAGLPMTPFWHEVR